MALFRKSQLSKPTALWFCSGISILYVAALYVIVPNSIQRLSRNDSRQIRWRSLATVLVSAVSLTLSWLISCENGIFQLSFAAVADGARASMVALGHVMVLYASPLVQSLIRINRMTTPSLNPIMRLKMVLKNYFMICIEPTIAGLFRADGNDQLQWILLRNYILAPLTEEVVFRCSIIPILKASGMNDRSVIWVAPLFFGFAHIHHIYLKYCQGEPLLAILLQTTIQFSYTTLFGIYASYVFLQTKSMWAVFVCHAFCNIMGLPDVSFLNRTSSFHSSRHLLGSLLVFGILLFYLGFVNKVLPKAVVESHQPSLSEDSFISGTEHSRLFEVKPKDN